MIKGVNRQIVEIKNIDCPYFERIICYVRPQFSSANQQMLNSSAVKYIKSLTEDDKKSRAIAKYPLWAIVAASAAVGAGLCFILMKMLS